MRALSDLLRSRRSEDAPAGDRSPEAWRRFAVLAPGLAAGGVALLVLLTVLLNPFGNFPVSAASQLFADDNQRYSYPAIIRSGRFDSAVFGTSTSRLLRPERLSEKLGGRFMTLSMDSATAWEQTQLARLFLHTVGKPANLVLALDSWVWCSPLADEQRVTFRLFPDAFYDDDPLNDVTELLNTSLPDALRRSIKRMFGFGKPYFAPDGFGDFTPGEGAYDARRAAAKIHSDPFANPLQPVVPPVVPTAADIRSYRFPALAWLADLLRDAPPETRRIIVRMPVHVVSQPQPGSAEAARLGVCEKQMEAIAAANGTYVLDMAFASPITLRDANYWDRLHFRLPVGIRAIDEIDAALRTGESSPVLRVIVDPRQPAEAPPALAAF